MEKPGKIRLQFRDAVLDKSWNVGHYSIFASLILLDQFVGTDEDNNNTVSFVRRRPSEVTGKSMVHCHESTQARAHGVLGKERLLKEGSHDLG